MTRSRLLIPALVAAAFAAMLVAAKLGLAQPYDYRVSSNPALTNSAVVVKASPGPVLWYQCYNPNATVAYLQVFDSAGSVTVGTTTPARSFAVAPLSTTGPQPPSPPLSGSAGLQIAATTTPTGGTAPGTALQCDVAFR